ncbi:MULTISPECIES: S9 family peptidase [Proteiniphilum]|uniref:S9 family peptidase n=1 Tax=Proteiniphilum TaxID=294702 RepID=UPI001EE9D06E|nr:MULTISPECIES: S9 family peptidase [Proteiniphilum]ULB34245.1 S9 family peptidase [Proteiniphilum propionicum]
MRKFLHVAMAVMCTLSVTAQNYSLNDILNGKFSPRDVREMVSSQDGLHYYQADPQRTAVIKFSYATGNAVDTLFSTLTARNCTFDSFQGFLVSPDENRVLVYIDREQIYRHSFRASYYYHDVRRNMIRKLTDKPSKQMMPTFSSDSKMAAYVIDNNIWLSKFDFDTESQITKDGLRNKIINGATDWVYEEEFGVTRLMEFSPDNRLLAFVRFDESPVKEFTFQTFNGQLYPGYYNFKYPKAGEANSSVECRVFDIESRTTRTMDLPVEEDGYIPRIKFTNDPARLAVMTLNRDQNRFDMYYVNPRTTVSKLVLREESEQYIDSDWLNSIHFLEDKFTYISEKDGFSHIYVYGLSGTLQKQLTSGSYDVTALLGVDPQSEVLFYQAADESPLRRNIYKINISKGKPQKLSNQPGFNEAFFSNNGKFFLNRWSDASTPDVISLHDSNGKQLRILEDNQSIKAEVASARLPKREYIKVTAADGITLLNGWILKPNNFNPSKKYPVVMIQYSGPNSQKVLDKYSASWYYALLNEDIVVACVDGRGTGARGARFRKCTYMNLGIIESDDQVAAAQYLGSLSYIDADRIGIWGWSYGGYNVLMSMSRGDGTLKAGVAIAPVTDWRFYDSVYTERFMRTPQQNSTGYINASAVELAGRLQGNLLLVHGTTDDNVHFQNTIEYTRALIKANKHFEMFVFPDKDHFISGGNTSEYLYEKVIGFYRLNL